MLNFDELKDKILATAGSVADKTAEAAKVAADKTKVLGKLTRLNTDLAKERDTLRRAYGDIGKMYYETHKANAEPQFEEKIAEIDQCLKLIEAKKAQIESLKSEFSQSQGYADYVDYQDEDDAAEDTHASTDETKTDSESDGAGKTEYSSTQQENNEQE